MTFNVRKKKNCEGQGQPIYFTPMTLSILLDKVKLISNTKYVHGVNKSVHNVRFLINKCKNSVSWRNFNIDFSKVNKK